VGNRIRELRIERASLFPSAFSVTALAHRVGVTDGMLRRWEKGSSKPSQRHARALAKELGVSIDQLGLREDPPGLPAGPASTELKPLAAAIIVRGGRVLLTERRFPGHGEQWSWPSGKVEGDESLEDAIRRELHEELLIADAQVIGHIGDIDLPSGFRMSHFHVALPPDAEPKLNDYEQLVRTEWMTRDEARLAFESLPAEVARQALALLDQVLSGQPSTPPLGPHPAPSNSTQASC
jgi:8-oxo-dGTP diphosphatase